MGQETDPALAKLFDAELESISPPGLAKGELFFIPTTSFS